MGIFWSQVFPPQPTFTEVNIPPLDGRVFVITGGNAGIGLEIVKMLYAKGGCTIYIVGRSAARVSAAIEYIQSTSPMPTSQTQLKSLIADFNDLATVPKAASVLLRQESRLDVLWNNAGNTCVPPGSTTEQGYEANMGVNCLGPHLFTKLLLPLLLETAKQAPHNCVRIIYTSSQIIDSAGPVGGLLLAEQEPGFDRPRRHWTYTYSASKAGNWFLASELDRRTRKGGLVCLVQHPGNVRTKAWETVPLLAQYIMSPFLYDAKMGAYTELWAGLSETVTTQDGGRFGVPWGGTWHPSPRKDILESLKSRNDGGTGLAADFWDWCENQTTSYASLT